MFSTSLAGPRTPASSPSVRPSFGQSVSTMVSKWRGAVRHTCQRSPPGMKSSTAGTGSGPAELTVQPAASMASPSPSRVPSTSPSGWTWPNMRASPRGRRSASSSGAGGCSATTVRPGAVGSLTSLALRPARALGAQLGQQRLDVGGVLHGAVGAGEQLRRGAQIEVPAEPAPHEATRALERLERLIPLRLRAQDRHVDLRVLEVRARLHLGHGDEARARVFELALDEHRDLFLDQLVDPLEPLGLHGALVARLEDLDLDVGHPAVHVV